MEKHLLFVVRVTALPAPRMWAMRDKEGRETSEFDDIFPTQLVDTASVLASETIEQWFSISGS